VEEAYLWEEDFPLEFDQAEAQYLKLYGIGNRRCQRLHAGDLLDTILHGSPRIPSSGQYFLPGQQEQASSSKRMKHVNIWYFFITDRIDKGDVSLVWCPTGDMIRDFMTKPLQGALFWKFRDQIMGVVPARDPGPGKAITKIDELNTHTVKPPKGNKLKPSRGTMYNLVPSKQKGWHHRSVKTL
jgi:hypothetical protein